MEITYKVSKTGYFADGGFVKEGDFYVVSYKLRKNATSYKRGYIKTIWSKAFGEEGATTIIPVIRGYELYDEDKKTIIKKMTIKETEQMLADNMIVAGQKLVASHGGEISESDKRGLWKRVAKMKDRAWEKYTTNTDSSKELLYLNRYEKYKQQEENIKKELGYMSEGGNINGTPKFNVGDLVEDDLLHGVGQVRFIYGKNRNTYGVYFFDKKKHYNIDEWHLKKSTKKLKDVFLKYSTKIDIDDAIHIYIHEGDKKYVAVLHGFEAHPTQIKEYLNITGDFNGLFLRSIEGDTDTAIDYAIALFIKYAKKNNYDAIFGYMHINEKKHILPNGFSFHGMNRGNENDFVLWMKDLSDKMATGGLIGVEVLHDTRFIQKALDAGRQYIFLSELTAPRHCYFTRSASVYNVASKFLLYKNNLLDSKFYIQPL